jgi:hypothetical protein
MKQPPVNTASSVKAWCRVLIPGLAVRKVLIVRSLVSEKGSDQQARPSTAQGTSSEEKFDIRSFVFACLEENAAATIESIQQRALSIGQSVSIGSISRYRKQYIENSAATFNPAVESDIETEIESA